VLPEIENRTLKARGKNGLYLYGQDVGNREIAVSFSIIAGTNTNVMTITRELALWLHNPEPVPLTLSDEPDLYYMVVPDGDTKLNEIATVGQGTIKFLCVEPYAYGPENTVTASPISSDPFQVPVAGTAEAYPLIEMKVRSSSTSLAVISDEKFVMLGDPDDVTKTPTNPFPKRLHDVLSNPASWTAGTAVDGGVIFGDYVSDGNSFRQANSDYGTGSGWHGAAKIKSLTTPIQDFEVHSYFGFKADRREQVGRMEAYLLDANNNVLGKVALVDKSDKNYYPSFEARAGTLNEGTYFGTRLRTDGNWTNKEGIMKISRKGNKWTANISVFDSTKTQLQYSQSYSWTDRSNKFTAKLAKVQLHVGAYGTKAKYKDMYYHSFRIFEYVELSATQTPIVVEKDDIILIDCEKSIVYKNGDPYFAGLNMASDFFSLKNGVNGLSLSPPIADVTVKYRERWL